MSLGSVRCSDDEIINVIKELKPLSDPKYEQNDEIKSGIMFADCFGSITRFNTTAGKWYVYDGIIWKPDNGNVLIESLAQRFVCCLRKYAAETLPLEATRKDRETMNYLTSLGSRKKRISMIEDAKAHIHIDSSQLDADPDLLNCKNFVFNLRTYEAVPHDAKYLLSKCTNFNYKKDAGYSIWKDFMMQVFQVDIDKTEYVQRLFGYGLTTDTSQEQCYLFYGATTRNGKSTMLDTISYMLGDYALKMSPDSLAQKKTDSRIANSDIARLQNCRFVHCSEPEKKMIFNVAFLKNVLGGEPINARYLYQDCFQFYPTFKIFINSNYLPTVNDDTLFSSGRIMVIEFKKHFDESEQDKTLKERFREDDVLSGIFNWCLIGLKSYRAIGLQPPQSVLAAVDDYRRKSDKISNFMDECFEKRPDSVLSCQGVYYFYTQWCRSNGYGVDNRKNFTQSIKAKEIYADSGTVNGHTIRNVIKGYAITDETREQYQHESNI